MKINLKARMKNKVFWLTMIPAICVLISQVFCMFGVKFDLSGISDQLKEIVETVFLIMGVVGIVVDPTTKGVSDSERALTYEKPQ
jgi:phi LC3 family holin